MAVDAELNVGMSKSLRGAVSAPAGYGAAPRSKKYVSKMTHRFFITINTVVPVMNGHPRDQAKVSVHCRWPLVTGTDGQAADAKYNTPCNTT